MWKWQTYTSLWFCSNRAFISSITCRTTSSCKHTQKKLALHIDVDRLPVKIKFPAMVHESPIGDNRGFIAIAYKWRTLYGGRLPSADLFNSRISSSTLSPNIFPVYCRQSISFWPPSWTFCCRANWLGSQFFYTRPLYLSVAWWWNSWS